MKTWQTFVLLSAMTIVSTAFETLSTAKADSLFRAYTASEREAIRHMPIEKRPNRIGHVYGNTVRRLNKFGR
jgi:hypothetical protein